MRNNNTFQLLNYILLVVLMLIIILGSYKLLFNKNNYDDSPSLGNGRGYTVTIKRNGATSVSKTNMDCVFKNDQCLVTLPNAIRKDGVVLGYSFNKDDKVSLYQVGQVLHLNKDITLYVISYQELFLNIDSTNLDYISTKNTNCLIYNDEKSCEVIIPHFNKSGYEVRGYSTNSNSYTGYIFPNQKYKLTKSMTLYPIYNRLTRMKTIDISNYHLISNTVFDIEKGCNSTIYNRYLSYFNRVSNNAPYLLNGGKVTFLTDKTFDEIWGESYAGMNYGPLGARHIDIRCSNSIINNYYATIIHELAHTWDFYYGNRLEVDISSTNEMINLFNKYRTLDNRPFREYSYSNIREFFADVVRYYYLKYVDPVDEYKNLVYYDDIKATLEKYICIANNNYIVDGC